jgi:hypothetical protein
MRLTAFFLGALALASVAVNAFTVNVVQNDVVTTITNDGTYATYTTVCTGGDWCGLGWSASAGMGALIAGICKNSDSTATLYYAVNTAQINPYDGSVSASNNASVAARILTQSSCVTSGNVITMTLKRPMAGDNTINPPLVAVSTTSYNYLIGAIGPLQTNVGAPPSIMQHSNRMSVMASLTALYTSTETPGPTGQTSQQQSAVHAGAAVGCVLITALLSKVYSMFF